MVGSRDADKADALFAALKTDPPIGVVCDAKGDVTLTGSATSEATETTTRMIDVRTMVCPPLFGKEHVIASESSHAST